MTAKIDITIPIHTLTMNKLLRMHFRARKKAMNDLAWHIRAAVKSMPATPMARARITIHRYTSGKIDPDNLNSIAKTILDVLQPCSKRHPLGMGFISGDGPEELELCVQTIVSQAKATRIVIEELP